MAVGRRASKELGDVSGVSEMSSFKLLELAQKLGLIRIGQRGGGRNSVQMNLWELMILALGPAVDPRNLIHKMIPEWLSAPASEQPGWSMSPFSSELWHRRGCCFGEVSIALDAYRDTIYPDLPKVADGVYWSGKTDSRCYQVLPGDTLGDALAHFVDYLSRAEGAHLRQVLRKSNWSLCLNSTMNAQVSFWDNGVTFTSLFDYARSVKSPVRFRSETFGFPIFDKMADLWADSRAHGEGLFFPLPSKAELPGSTPGYENAALPGAASSIIDLQTKPKRARTADRSLTSGDLTARACVPSRLSTDASRSPQKGTGHGRRTA